MPYVATNGKSHSQVCQADLYLTHPCLCLSFSSFQSAALENNAHYSVTNNGTLF